MKLHKKGAEGKGKAVLIKEAKQRARNEKEKERREILTNIH